ncbi:MAG: thermostable hemolysin [Pseudomonadota bacterium]|jgi:hypothetical protein|nr:thermostable hemolysin [Pseudomonadota bacterium]
MSDPLTLSMGCHPNPGAVKPVLRCAGRWFHEITPESEMEQTVAVFIRRRFLQAYGAEPALRIPRLLALTTAHGSLLAAVGVRRASEQTLFLEDYLDHPVDTHLPGAERDRIAEIAHLAGVEAGVSRYLFASLSVWLESAGYDWVVCTGTDQLRNSFHRLGIATQVIAPADPARLADGGAGWGRYYDHHPVVMAIRVADGLNALRAGGLLNLVHHVVQDEQQPTDTGGRYGWLA